MGEPIGPSDCAFAIGLPLTREAAIADLSPQACRDFVKLFCQDRSFEAFWRQYESDVRVPYQQFRRRAISAGAAVLEEWVAADLHHLLRQYPVVVVFTHWKSPSLFDHDVLDFERLVQAMTYDPPGGEPLTQPISDVPAACDILRAWICQGDASTSIKAAIARRAAVDRKYRPYLSPGNALDMPEGLLPPRDLARCLGPSLDGVLDLSACCSVYYAEELRNYVTGGSIVTSSKLISISAKFMFYANIIDILKTEKWSFLEASYSLRDCLVRDGVGRANNHEP
ncbi:MAG: hypothetical protein EOP84_02325 [Verrucomicrobiaceae bacterium]|nr:MAG: hypothetical protein EOP84_02325 [Verrucomicrobiaceae bacterium]